MSEPSRTNDSQLDSDEILAQTSAIAMHLQRSGVQWMPKARSEAVESLRGQFASSGDESSESQVETAHRPSAVESPAVMDTTGEPSRRPSPPQPVADAPVSAIEQTYAGTPLSIDQRQLELDSIAGEVRGCQRCEILANCRKQTVFGEGNPAPRFVFFGEGPGAEEDQSGRPFVGRAGQLLTKMIEACTLRREDVYIMNTVKCRPPGNRNPEPGELENCRDYYRRQLQILRPEYIVCLGAISSQELMQNKTSVGKMRGRLHRYFESKVLVTYHPAYLLRTPAAKRAAWDDLQLMIRDAGISLGTG